MKRPRINAKSIPILRRIDDYVRKCDMRGDALRFHDAAADVCDGHYNRRDLDDLIRGGFLSVVRYSLEEAGFPWPPQCRDTCGTVWSVNPTKKMIRTLWPDRFVSVQHQTQ